MKQSAAIGIDLGGTHLRAALVTACGEVLDRQRVLTPRDGSETLLDCLNGLLASLAARAAERGFPLHGAGLGIPGTVSRSRVVRCPNLPFLDGVDLAERLLAPAALPLQLCNDADAAALGEHRYGAGRGLSSLLMLTLGTGVGGALIHDGRLWRGADGLAGEVGHVMVEPEGPSCACGSRGCLEQYASASAILATARTLVGEGYPHGFTPSEIASLDGSLLATAAARGDQLAREVYRRAGCRLGQVIAGVAANLLNLEGVVIGGGAAAALEWMLPALRGELAARAFARQGERLAIRAAALDDDAGVVGAALLAQGG